MAEMCVLCPRLDPQGRKECGPDDGCKEVICNTLLHSWVLVPVVCIDCFGSVTWPVDGPIKAEQFATSSEQGQEAADGVLGSRRTDGRGREWKQGPIGKEDAARCTTRKQTKLESYLDR